MEADSLPTGTPGKMYLQSPILEVSLRKYVTGNFLLLKREKGEGQERGEGRGEQKRADSAPIRLIITEIPQGETWLNSWGGKIP